MYCIPRLRRDRLWGQQLSFHPHVHCIVSGGGITSDNTWKDAKKNRYGFLFPVKAMQAVFRGKFLQSLQQLIDRGEVTMPQGTEAQQLFNLLYNKDWVVYAKAPFSGPHTVIEYLGRYTHKVAISNHRIAGINKENQTVTFEYKDYADNNNKKQMTLPLSEFIRRFQQHILPPRFTKIRTYGYLSNRNRHQRINHILKSMKLPLHKPVLKVPLQLQVLLHFSIDITECPCCKSKTMQLIQLYYPWKQSDDG
ncbi:MAG: transposase [Flavisolibacter sp.]|nr:transposase [Flavisolibacter sp.]